MKSFKKIGLAVLGLAMAFGLLIGGSQKVEAGTKGYNIIFHPQLAGGNKVTGYLVTSVDGKGAPSQRWESGDTAYLNLDYGRSGRTVTIEAVIKWRQFLFFEMKKTVVKTVWIDANTNNIYIATTN